VLVNAFNLLFGLLFFNRLVIRLGVPTMALLQPGAYLITFAYLLMNPGFGSAMAGFFAYQGLMPAITYDTHNLLLKRPRRSSPTCARSSTDWPAWSRGDQRALSARRRPRSARARLSHRLRSQLAALPWCWRCAPATPPRWCRTSGAAGSISRIRLTIC
jgi:hypothetical protein